MAKRFVRIDLSDTARDFRPVALEPGVPLLDKSYGNAKILFRWLGGLVADPEWDEESVNFFVRDEYGGRIEDVECQLATAEDLKGVLQGDVEAVRQRLTKVKPETSTERAVYKIVSAQFLDLIDNPNRLDRDNYFFRYRDVQGRWRLVWCWGYQRIGQQPATPLVCTAADCNLLFVRRPGESAKCPSCEAHVALAPVRPKRDQWYHVAGRMFFLFLLLSALLLYGLYEYTRLRVMPERWAGRVGERVAFQVVTNGLFGIGRRDVTRQWDMESEDPKIVRIDPAANAAIATAPGQTRVLFVGSKGHHIVATATMTVEAASPTAALAAEPAERPAAKPAAAQSAASAEKPAVTSSEPLKEEPGAMPTAVPADKPAASPSETPAMPPTVATSRDRPAETPAADVLTLQDADGKRLDAVELRVGQRLGLGEGLSVLRGATDVSRQCTVAPMRPEVVKFDEESRSLTGAAAGQSPVKFSLGDKSLLAVVQVAPPTIPGATAEPVTDLKLEPAEATIHPGQGLFYQVTGVRGGQRRALGPQDNVRLSTKDSAVAAPLGGTVVQGERAGRTEVVAQVGQQQAKAVLTVAPGTGAPRVIVEVLPGSGVVEGWGPDVEYFDAEGVHPVQPLHRRLGPDGEAIVEGPGREPMAGPTDTLAIEPQRASIKLGESTPHFTVSLRGADGAQRVLNAVPLSADETILVRDSQDPARFVARGPGRTQVRATYGGRDVFADVTVTGERFAAVKTSIADQGDRDFQVSAEIAAADPDTPLEYRVYVAGQTPPDAWTPSQQQGGSRRAVVESPRIKTGPVSAFYQLIFEARDPRDKSIQKYPYAFRLGRTIEEVKGAPPAGVEKSSGAAGKPPAGK